MVDKVGIARKRVMLCLNKYARGGVENTLFDDPGCGRNAMISDEEKTWIINIPCQKSKNLEYAAETLTYTWMTFHINKYTEASGFIINECYTKEDREVTIVSVMISKWAVSKEDSSLG